jgi:purine-binding chemotaxis protein CheW
MSDMVHQTAERVALLRQQFDGAFAEPARIDRANTADLLSINVGGLACALRLCEIGGLFVDRKVTRVPGGVAELRGIAAFRGALLPVYDLAALLGRPAQVAPRWLVIAAALPVALAFDAFERQLRISHSEIVPQGTQSGLRGHAHEIVRSQVFTGPVLHLPAVVEAIVTLRAAPAARTEQ